MDDALDVQVETWIESMASHAGGTQLWASRYTGGSNGSPVALVLDTAGNVYVTGGSTSTYVTINYDTLGSQSWVAGGGVGIAINGAGNIYMTSGWGFDTLKYSEE